MNNKINILRKPSKPKKCPICLTPNSIDYSKSIWRCSACDVKFCSECHSADKFNETTTNWVCGECNHAINKNEVLNQVKNLNSLSITIPGIEQQYNMAMAQLEREHNEQMAEMFRQHNERMAEMHRQHLEQMHEHEQWMAEWVVTNKHVNRISIMHIIYSVIFIGFIIFAFVSKREGGTFSSIGIVFPVFLIGVINYIFGSIVPLNLSLINKMKLKQILRFIYVFSYWIGNIFLSTVIILCLLQITYIPSIFSKILNAINKDVAKQFYSEMY